MEKKNKKVSKCKLCQKVNKYKLFQWFSSLIVIGWWMVTIDLFSSNHEALKKLYYSIFQNNSSCYSIFQLIYRYRTVSLIIATVIALIIYGYCFFSKKEFKKLNENEFGQYSGQEYHTQLVHFLNKKVENGSNIFWLDGLWGSGKTKFLNVFFENQDFEINNLYKVSCFGLKTREQLENNLRAQIDMKSPFMILQKFPIIGELLIYISQTIGINRIKKDSIIIFDDLERAHVYFPDYEWNSQENKLNVVDDEESVQIFNNILGYIDYLAENFPVKVIVVLNKKEIPKTEIIWSKFKTGFYQFENWNEILDSLLLESLDESSNEFKFLKNYYMFIILHTKKLNFRSVKHAITVLNSEKKDESTIQKHVTAMLNDYDSILTKWPISRSHSTIYGFFNFEDIGSILPDFLTSEEIYLFEQEHCEMCLYFIKIFKSLWDWENKSNEKLFPGVILKLEDIEDELLLQSLSGNDREKKDNELDYRYDISLRRLSEAEIEEINYSFQELIEKYKI